MSTHEYTPDQALATILKALQDHAEAEGLVSTVQAAIDAGKDRSEVEVGRGRTRRRTYRRMAPLDDQEALFAALDVLQAYLVEQPLFIQSVETNFAGVTVSPRAARSGGTIHTSVAPGAIQADVAIQIELQTETKISKGGRDVLVLKAPPRERVEEQKGNLARLRQLVDFRRT